MGWSQEFCISFILAVIPILWGIGKWVWKHYFAIKRRALSIEYVESKQYIHKRNDKVELKVIYNNSITCDSLVTLRIAINNCGQEDIPESSLIDPITISFSDKYEILEVSRAEDYDKIKPSIIYTRNSIVVSWALLKHQSKFEIDIIAKSNNKHRDLSTDFYNSLSCDINIVGIDDVPYERQSTTKDKALMKSKRKIFLVAIYTFFLLFSAIRTYTFPDYTVALSLQKDSLLHDSKIYVYSRNDIVEVDYFDESLTIHDFNDSYNIIGISGYTPKINSIFSIIYLCGACICVVGIIWLTLIHVRRKNLYT